jgi:hypothetical protein
LETEETPKEKGQILPAASLYSTGQSYQICRRSPGPRLRYGHPCPFCHANEVDYDSTLTLYCKKCGKVQSGSFT